jgi:ComF family protein
MTAAPAGALPALTRAGGRLLDLAFPPRCAGCGAEAWTICPACRPGLFRHLDRPGGVLLGLPGDVPAPLVQVDWCAPFEGVVRNALHQLKYAGERRLAGVLGEALERRWRTVGAGGDLLVPVPIHRDRERQRGYDQAVLLAEAAGRGLRLPFAPALERARATHAQFDLDRRHRAANVAGAFRVRSGMTDTVRGRWIVLVDDVMTTGATLTESARALMAAGAEAVSALAVAREQ